jgi:clathrin heavy chain
LYEEAFVVYKKINQPVEAVKVLLEYLNAIDRAAEYADKINNKDVWTELGLSYLKNK